MSSDVIVAQFYTKESACDYFRDITKSRNDDHLTFCYGGAYVSIQILPKLIGIADFWYQGFCVIESLKLLTASDICLCLTLQQARHKLSKVRNVTGLHHTNKGADQTVGCTCGSASSLCPYFRQGFSW